MCRYPNLKVGITYLISPSFLSRLYHLLVYNIRIGSPDHIALGLTWILLLAEPV